MEIKIFVVQTEIEQNQIAQNLLSDIKTELVNRFRGLTEFEKLKGYWLTDNGYLCFDKTDLWLICSNAKPSNTKQELRAIALKIKAITNQQTQLYLINNKPYLV